LKDKPDKTIADRERRHREARNAGGWKRISVWVPTASDAEDVRKLAAERRARAENLDELKELNVKPETIKRIAAAIDKHGSNAYMTASGALLDLMTELTEEDDLPAVSAAYCILARAKPASAPYVANAVPAKISNFLIRHRGIDGGAFYNWTVKNPSWAETIANAVSDPARFTSAVETMAEDIKRH
jgi:hypothetical protein